MKESNNNRSILWLCPLCLLLAGGATYLILYLLSFHHVIQTATSNLMVNGTVQVGKKPECDGLYSTSHIVSEICKEELLETLIQEKNNLMVVFYASWCGHCVNFAPKFKSIAEKTSKARTNFNLDQSESDGTSNDLKLANQTALGEISFGAVDCVHFRTLCDKHNVEAYPTVISFNFGSRNGKGVKLMGREEDIYKFLKNHYFKGQVEIADVKKSLASKTSIVRGIPPTTKNPDTTTSSTLNPPKPIRPAGNPTPVKIDLPTLSHYTTSKTRWNDAITSFYFFLLNELPKHMTESRFKLLKDFLNAVVLVTKDPKLTSIQRKLQENNVKWNFSSNNNNTATKSIRSIVSSVITEQQIRWRVCGVADLQGSPLRKNGHNNSALGYSCGLWMLFHGLTVNNHSLVVSSALPSLRANSSAALKIVKMEPNQVMSLIYGFVTEFFGCLDCRAHFMDYYTRCLFDRCVVGKDFSKLQLWLFHLHNFVTLRIKLEKSHNHFLTPELLKKSIDNHVWPSYKSCPRCYRYTTATTTKQSNKDKNNTNSIVEIGSTTKGISEEKIRIFLLQTANQSAMNFNHKYHKQELTRRLEVILPTLLHDVLNPIENLKYLTQSFLSS